MPRVVFSVPIGSSPLPVPSYASNYIPEDIDLFNDFTTTTCSSPPTHDLSLSTTTTISSPTPIFPAFDLFTLVWLLSLCALFFLTDNHMRTQRHDHAKWLDAHTEKIAYAYECQPRRKEERGESPSIPSQRSGTPSEQARPSRAQSEEGQESSPGVFSALFDGFASGAALMLAA